MHGGGEHEHDDQDGAAARPAVPDPRIRALRVAPTASTPPPLMARPGDDLRLAPGLRIRHYEVIRPLGRGGMGQVVVARDLKLGRLVALKFVIARSPQFAARFVVEARATARCHHENIVVVFEVDEHAGHPYMVLELLDGEPLDALLAHGPLSAHRTVEIARPIARALIRAHDVDIVHRDLKPDNVFLTRTGQIKVLDFGVAKLYQGGEAPADVDAPRPASNATLAGTLIGTPPYMSPEQWGTDAVDHRTDLWAMGILLWQMLAGRHPLGTATPESLRRAASDLDAPMPAIADAVPDLPAPLARIVDRCLAKRKADRWGSARELLTELDLALPAQRERALDRDGAGDDNPFLGLQSFQESDAHRFFGRAREATALAARIRDEPLLAVVGVSGVGKSSLIRAGLVPALRGAGEAWEVLTVRPGRTPLTSLATVLQPLLESTAADPLLTIAEHERLVDRLADEPGFLGALLRARARRRDRRVLLVVDQLEELYTMGAAPGERRAFTACLAGAADDAAAPVRIVASMRSDFLDRVVEDRVFTDRLARAMVFVPPVDPDGLRDALVRPLELAGYRFEPPEMADELVAALERAPAALPWLQFTASRLWELRDPSRRAIPRRSYDAIGGVAGALAGRADEVLSAMSAPRRPLARALLLRLVTGDGTRAVVDVDDLAGLGGDRAEVGAVLDHLVSARLVVVQPRSDGGGPSAELVHESLIASWPTLRRWIDESHEDAALVAQLAAAARQWDGRARPDGLVWQGDAADEAVRFARRSTAQLAPRERAYLDAVVRIAQRAARRRRRLVLAVIAVLAALATAASGASLWIRSAERTAQEQRDLAEREAARARTAELRVTEQLKVVEDKERLRLAAERMQQAAETTAKDRGEALSLTREELEVALARAKEEARIAKEARDRAETLARTEKEHKARIGELAAKLASLYEAEQEKVKRLEKEKARLMLTLPDSP